MRPGSRGRRGGDRGSATIWAAGVIMVIAVALMFVVEDIGAVHTRHRAEAAADLAALAAAERAVDGPAAACARAQALADRFGVTITSCRLRGWDAYLDVTAALPIGLGRFGMAHARSRAGPSPSDDPS